jgi:hypothetical protein
VLRTRFDSRLLAKEVRRTGGTMRGALVQGHVEEGWGKVADAFRANFEGNPSEVGAASLVRRLPYSGRIL